LLTYGSYPGIVGADENDKKDLLKNIASNYLYKDIFSLDQIKKPLVFEMLVKKLAIDTGKQISLDEIASSLGTNKKTIERYIGLLEQAFIIKKLGAFSRNKANELKKSFKVYFYDIGLCNTIAERVNFDSLKNYIGLIFENFFIMERMKKNLNDGKYASLYFWRTYEKYEIDLIEESEGEINSFECKWSENGLTKSQHLFLKEYKNSKTYLVNRENYTDFL
jgi:predicted AAA+ superfamily ATPase